MTRCWHCSQKVPPLACVFQCGCLALELTGRGPQPLRVFLSCRAGTSTALVTVVQLSKKQSCEHQCNPAAPTSTAPALHPACGMAEQGPLCVLLFPAPCRPWPLALPTYLCCDPLPGLQAASSSRTKQSIVMWSARTATSMSLHSLTLRRHRASLRVQLQWRSVRLSTLCSWYLTSWGAIWCSHLPRCLLHLHPLPGPEESGEVRGTPST